MKVSIYLKLSDESSLSNEIYRSFLADKVSHTNGTKIENCNADDFTQLSKVKNYDSLHTCAIWLRILEDDMYTLKRITKTRIKASKKAKRGCRRVLEILINQKISDDDELIQKIETILNELTNELDKNCLKVYYKLWHNFESVGDRSWVLSIFKSQPEEKGDSLYIWNSEQFKKKLSSSSYQYIIKDLLDRIGVD